MAFLESSPHRGRPTLKGEWIALSSEDIAFTPLTRGGRGGCLYPVRGFFNNPEERALAVFTSERTPPHLIQGTLPGPKARVIDEARPLYLYSYATVMNVREEDDRPNSRELRMTTYEYLNLIAAYSNLLASYGGLALIYYGIRIMSKNADMRAADSERKHAEAMSKHDEAMAESRRRDEESVPQARRDHGRIPPQGGRRPPKTRGIHGRIPEQARGGPWPPCANSSSAPDSRTLPSRDC